MKFTRRQFLSTSAAAAAPMIVPASVFGQNAPSNRLALGFIGCGTMNYGHLKGVLKMADAQIVAVCDVDKDRREFFRKTVDAGYAKEKREDYKGCAEAVDYHDLIARKDIDALVVATPDHWHTAIAVEAMKAGKDVYCEKPLTLTVREAKLMIDAAAKTGRVLQTGSQQRSSGPFGKALELIKAGRLGKIQKIIVGVGTSSKPCDLPEEPMQEGLDWDRWLGPAPKRPYHSVLSPRGVHTHFPAWRNYKEYSGGMMTDWGAHHFDIAQWFLGMDESGPVEIIPPEDPKATKGVRYVYENGVEVVHGESKGLTVIGTDGKLEVDRGSLKVEPEAAGKEPLKESDFKLPKSPGHMRNWMECIKTRSKPICHAEVGARSVTVCHLGNIAYWERKPLKWDPKAWAFKEGGGDPKWLDRERRDGFALPTL